MEFGVLGGLQVRAEDGAEVALVGARQQRALAGLLLSADRVLTADRLIALIWDESPPPSAAHQVHKVISALRQRLPGGAAVITTVGPAYRLVLTGHRIDVQEFERLLGVARVAADRGDLHAAATLVAQALRWRRGRALADIEGQEIRNAARQLDERVARAAEWCADLQIRTGRSAAALALLTELASNDPSRESVARLQMIALYETGNSAQALEVFGRLKSHLADDLGIDPSPALRETYQQILREQPIVRIADPVELPGRRTFRPHTLPRDLADFVGRTDETRHLLAILSAEDRTHPLICLSGMGGIGKTALAIRLATLADGKYPDGVLYLDLQGFTPGAQSLSTTDALARLLQSLEPDRVPLPDTSSALVGLWRSVTADRAILVLLDNVPDSNAVRSLLPASRSSAVICTSRRVLTDLDGAVPVALDSPLPDECLLLLDQIIGSRVREDPADALDLVTLCGALPLALRMMATRLAQRPQWPLRYVLDRLRDERRRLTELAAGTASVSASLSLSYNAMTRAERRALRLIGQLLPAEFDEWAAAATLGLDSIEASRLLDGLVDTSLLSEPHAGRYRMHDLVRDYTRSLEDGSSSEFDEAQRRLDSHRLGRALSAAQAIAPHRHQFLDVGEHRAIPAFTLQTATSWLTDHVPILDAATRSAVDRGDHLAACELARVLALEVWLGRHSAGVLEIQELAVGAAREHGDQRLLAICLANASFTQSILGDLQGSVQTLAGAIEVSVRDGQLAEAAVYRSSRALLEAKSGRLHRAHQELTLLRAETDGVVSDLRVIVQRLGWVQLTLGRLEAAIETLEEAVHLGTRAAEPLQVLRAVTHLANAHVRNGSPTAAIAAVARVGALAEEIGTTGARSLADFSEAEVLAHLGDARGSFDAAERALAGMPDNSDTALAEARIVAAAAAIRLGRTGHASMLLDAAEKIIGETGYRMICARLSRGRADMHAALGDDGRATSLARAARVSFREMSLPWDGEPWPLLDTEPTSGQAFN